MKSSLVLILGTLLALVSCNANQNVEKQVQKVIEEKPEIIIQAIEKHPVKFVKAFQKAVKSAQDELAKEREEEERKKLEATFDNPLKPLIRSDETFRGGGKNAPITLVEYSDFECPFCTRGFNTVVELLKKYDGKVRFVYKHLPLSFHKNAMPASRYYEAIRLQDEKKAFAFHDAIFEQQKKLRNGESFLKAVAKKVGADMKRLAKDVKSEAVQKRIDQDMEEAASFGMQGTPGFIINGIPVKGAYPTSHFVDIIEKLVQKGKLKL